MKPSIIIFASGRGSNAQAIIDHFRNSPVKISLIVTNNPDAGVLDIAAKEKIEPLIVNRQQFNAPGFASQLKSYGPALIILAGFLWKIPDAVIHAFPDSIINIHPALLPNFGGKGMYGAHVHEAVIAAGEPESGITVHYVNEVYDSGNIILQARCPVRHDDTADSLAAIIHKLEHFYYPRVIEFLLNDRNR